MKWKERMKWDLICDKMKASESIKEKRRHEREWSRKIKWEGKNEMNRREWNERRREKEEETMTVKKKS